MSHQGHKYLAKAGVAKSERSTSPKEGLPIPVNPVLQASLRALYAGGPKTLWRSDAYGGPQFCYESRDGCITIFCEPPHTPETMNAFRKLYFTPRLGFIYAGSLWEWVHKLSVETADVFLILMSRIARLQDPQRDIARIRLEEISEFRSIRVRHGSAQKLQEDFKRQVLCLADLRLTMEWRDYRKGGTMSFGKERPDRLLDIVDIEYKGKTEKWTAFGFRCGQALAHFLNPAGLRWIGYYARTLLHLSPYHEAFAKKLGTYWILLGCTSGKKGTQPRATPRSILGFCGEKPNWRNPGQTVDAFIKAHHRLKEISVLEDIPILEPPTRNKGYFGDWLDEPLTVKLSENLWQITHAELKSGVIISGRSQAHNRSDKKTTELPGIPENAKEIQDDPTAIRRFRADYGLHQNELARAVGVTRQTLSKYERGVSSLPEDTATKILMIWQQKARS